MDKPKIPHKVTGARFVGAVRNFAGSEDGWKAKLMFGALIALLFGINGMNVVNSYVGRDFMTAIADRNQAEFIRQAVFYIGVFAASTLVSVVSRFTEERLALLWRDFLTRRAISYLSGQRHLLPPERIRRTRATRTSGSPRTSALSPLPRCPSCSCCSTAASPCSPSPACCGRSARCCSSLPSFTQRAGHYLTIVLGRPLIRLNYDQLDKEANFRSGLIHVAENAEGGHAGAPGGATRGPVAAPAR